MRDAVLITGGAGFLGKNLIKYYNENYKDEIYKIIVVDNFISSSVDEFKQFTRDNELENFIILLPLDITEPFFIDELKSCCKINDVNIKYVYHFASIASPILYKKYPIETLQVGYVGTKNLLDFCTSYCPSAKILFSSTSEVYGDPSHSPQEEAYYGNVNTCGERSCYDESKRVAESLMYIYARDYNMNIRIARIFNTYGPYMSLKDGRIITEIIKSILHNTELKIYNGGNQTRSLCYVDDTINMLVELCHKEGITCFPVNCGSNIEISINNLVHTCELLFNKNIEKTYITSDKDDPKMRLPCLKQNFKILGPRRFTNISSGIIRTMNYFDC